MSYDLIRTANSFSTGKIGIIVIFSDQFMFPKITYIGAIAPAKHLEAHRTGRYVFLFMYNIHFNPLSHHIVTYRCLCFRRFPKQPWDEWVVVFVVTVSVIDLYTTHTIVFCDLLEEYFSCADLVRGRKTRTSQIVSRSSNERKRLVRQAAFPFIGLSTTTQTHPRLAWLLSHVAAAGLPKRWVSRVVLVLSTGHWQRTSTVLPLSATSYALPPILTLLSYINWIELRRAMDVDVSGIHSSDEEQKNIEPLLLACLRFEKRTWWSMWYRFYKEMLLLSW